MFKRRENAKAFLFEFPKPLQLKIHSWFVNFKFIAIWLDHLGNIIEIQKVSPWKLSVLPSRKFVKLIEIPCNRKYKDICDILVEGKRFKY